MMPCMAACVALALVLSRLDQMNSLFPIWYCFERLERVQSAPTRVVVNKRFRPPFSSSAVLKQLHWLPPEWRTVQTRHLNFQALHRPTGHPSYLTDLLQHHQLTKSFTFVLFSSAICSTIQPVVCRLDLVLSAFQPHGSGTICLSAFANLSHFMLLSAISRLTFPVSLSQPLATHPLKRSDSLTL